MIKDIKTWQLALDKAEGSSLMEQHILETPHPIERGKTISFPTLVFEGAAGILIKFDRRCQNEENQDQLIFNSYFSSQKKAMNLTSNYNSNTFLANGLRVSGNRVFKHPVFMIGNTLEVQFISTATARKNLESLSQWGYKLYVCPFLRVPSNPLPRIEDCDSRLDGEDTIQRSGLPTGPISEKNQSLHSDRSSVSAQRSPYQRK